jgi:hypothetical protein
LQPSYKAPFAHLRAGKKRIFSSIKHSKACRFSLSKNVEAFKSYSCFKKLEKNVYKNKRNKISVVFYASKKRKPQKKIPMAFVLVPLKNWGTLYFLND